MGADYIKESSELALWKKFFLMKRMFEVKMSFYFIADDYC